MPTVPSKTPSNSLAMLGFTPDEEKLYRLVLSVSGGLTETVATMVGRSAAELERDLAGFVDAGLVRFESDRVHAEPPASAISGLIEGQAGQLRRIADQLDGLVASMPALRAAYRPTPAGEEQEPIAGEVRVGGDTPGLLSTWIAESTGDMLWFRPDQWRLPHEAEITGVVGRAITAGRRSRAIYPASVLEEAPDVLVARAEAGEEVRIVAELPSRMAVIGEAGVLLPENWGAFNDRRVLVHQPVLREALTYLFEQVWSRAIVVPGLPAGQGAPAPDTVRRLLLEQLADGAKDEQIARALGLGLRTVRRRVAELLDDLAVETRFQAGVEAVRRGWL